jgi:phospholipid/cholesterol/gamma-HCH transport system substrate-binding protein
MSGRRAAGGALAGAVLVVALLVLLSGSSPYVLHLRFADAGQLVNGDRVEVGGVQIGSVTSLALTADGQADVTVSINDARYAPMHTGTRAAIRAPGLAGVAERYVAIDPAPESSATLRSGAVIGTGDTSGIVDIDELLDAETPQVRADLRSVFAHGADVYAGSSARYFNRLLAQLSPALAQTSSLTRELGQDRVGLTELIDNGDVAAHALAQPDALQADVTNVAGALSALARERQPLADLLQRAPAALSAGQATLAGLGTTIAKLRSPLRELPAAAAPLSSVLSELVPVGRSATPVVARLNGELGPLGRALRGFKPLQAIAPAALRATAGALKQSLQILTGLRYYAPDFLLGVTNGLGGLAGGNYDANGHYARVEFVNAPQTGSSGLLAALTPSGTVIPGQFGVREHLTARCPGGDAPPAPDGSNPWLLGSFWCNPSDDIPLSVDFP